METGLNFSLLLVLATFAAAAAYAVEYFCAPRLSPKEPPLLTHPIPYIGHVLGLLRHGTRYYEMTRLVALLSSPAEEIDTDYLCSAVQSASFPSTL